MIWSLAAHKAMFVFCGTHQPPHLYKQNTVLPQQLISALVLGVDGAVGSTYNFMAGVYQRMMEAMDRGDMDTARKEQYRSQRTCKLLFNYGQYD